jgi:hypothetical protein
MNVKLLSQMACKEVIDTCEQNLNGRVLNFTAIGDANCQANKALLKNLKAGLNITRYSCYQLGSFSLEHSGQYGTAD